MGLRGPAKRDASEEIARGIPGRRKVQSLDTECDTNRDVALELVVPQKPSYLTKEASAVWDDLLPKMLQMDSIRAVDARLLADYCQIAGEMDRCQAKLAKEGFFRKNANRTLSKREEVSLLKELRKEQLKLADVLGLTPKSRKQLNITIKAPQKQDASTSRANRILGRK